MVLFVDRASYKSIELIIAYPFSWFTAYDYSFGILNIELINNSKGFKYMDTVSTQV
jgi:hypothetical protein